MIRIKSQQESNEKTTNRINKTHANTSDTMGKCFKQNTQNENQQRQQSLNIHEYLKWFRMGRKGIALLLLLLFKANENKKHNNRHCRDTPRSTTIFSNGKSCCSIK